MVDAYGLSDPGRVRENNEDYFLIASERGLYVVADGMGGAQAGERASKLAAETVAEVVAGNAHRSRETLANAFQEANSRVRSLAATDSSLEGMGTTLVAVLECDDHLEIASVGDSRCYLYTGSELMTITEDQTWVQEVGARLGLDEEKLRSHPYRHVLTMAIGASQSLKVHFYSLDLLPDQQILLSSDGLHGVIPEETVADILSSERSLADKCHLLVEAARTAGGPDNITVVLLRTSA